ncbi:double-stranded RNA-binding protein 3 isoform X2 [Arachis ipaensis]|uniref:double-stranded RNA-binding protein 3 isoform X2 n=1 Tax=Arachis ipaensis TaxID=130454 RepID=UPI000A2B89F4|nr:double-stranded RNA-binding protein 3 isoform X2 [Arachis ipaensis]XP_025668593.1 double-stranded RNA-binding protein 3 isoform X1 [Arachis hypogaea]
MIRKKEREKRKRVPSTKRRRFRHWICPQPHQHTTHAPILSLLSTFTVSLPQTQTHITRSHATQTKTLILITLQFETTQSQTINPRLHPCPLCPLMKTSKHETGLCKNLLQEYAQKMNYAMPMYHSQKDETPSRAPRFTCTVDIGGILYIGGAAKTKKEAEIKAARTALLAIQSSASSSQNQLGHSQLTVIPCRKRAAETVPPVDETSKPPKPKKRFRKKSSKRKFSKDKTGRNAENAGAGANINPGVESHANISNESGFKETKCDGAFISEAMKSSENGILLNYCEKEVLVKEGSPVMNGNGSVEIGNSTKLLSKDPEASVEMNKQQDNGEIINEL